MAELFNKPKIVNNLLELIGGTPLVRLNKYATNNNVVANILLKMEIYQPSFSIKDRTVLSIIEEAEKKGDIIPGKTTIIEATSGNTGISLAMICAIKGYKCVIVMTHYMSLEKKLLMTNYGAKIILINEKYGMRGAISKAFEIYNSYPTGDAYLLNQFNNETAVKVHFEKTGPEIWYQTDNLVDIIIAGVGTGSTIVGIYNYIKTVNPNIQIIAVEPLDSPVLSGGEPGYHQIQGIGSGFIPDIIDVNIFNEIIAISNDDAKKTANDILLTDGLNVGFSSGATISAAINVGKRIENKDKNIVVIVASSGERYLTSNLYENNQINVFTLPIEDINIFTQN
jgi:cysteine synthase A